jgi:two-component SAPR family response regulator
VLKLRPAIRVLYMTGYTRNAIIHHGRLDPDIDLLTKPFTADALTRKVRRMLDASAPAKQIG